MLLSIALAAAISSAQRPAATAQATVRIARAVSATKEDWTRNRSIRKREITIVENGRPLTVRLIEFE